jgi:endonuclease III
MRQRFPTWNAVGRASVDALASVIHDAGLSRVKARQIKRLLGQLLEDFGDLTGRDLRQMKTDALERYLADLPGVGLKTARCVMMYALDRAVFPVDTHCMRLFHHLGIIEGRMRFEYAQDLLQDMVPPGIRRTLHVNTVALGRYVCIPRAERCVECPIRTLCEMPTEFKMKRGRRK